MKKTILVSACCVLVFTNSILAQIKDTSEIYYPALIPDLTYFVENVTFNELLEDKLWEIREEMPDESLLGHQRVANQISIRSKGNDKDFYSETESWCILEELDLSEMTNENIEFSFWNYTRYANGDPGADWYANIELLATSDFNESVTLTQWDNLTHSLDTLDKALDYDDNWVKSTASLDEYRGQSSVRLAFKFTVPKDGIMSVDIERPGNWWITDVRVISISDRNVSVTGTTYTDMVFPNPANNIVYFKERAQNLKIYSLSGREADVHYNSESNLINISDLPAGIYLLKMNFENGVLYTTKLIRE